MTTDRPTMPARMLRLLSLLQSRRTWSGAELAGRLGVTGRTVRRDVDRLRELGYPVHGTTGTAGGYRLASGRDLPPLLLDDDEAVAIAVGLRTAAAGGGVAGIEETSVRALAKLEQVLPARLRARVAAVGAASVRVPVGQPLPEADPDALAVLAAACRDHEVVTFDYRGRAAAAPERRRAEPHSLATAYGRWYVIAYDTDRAGWRVFRLDRLTGPAPVHRRFTPRDLPGGPGADPAAYLAATLTAAPYRFTAAATVGAPAAEVLARLPAPLPGRVTPLDEGRCRVTFGADSPDLITHDLVALAGLPVVLDEDTPAALRAHLRDVGRALAAM
ncbi:WYL domain-containing protein [Streptomyces sp. PA03-1a]|nr:WYL domain-containing protein [Streptomyces sp. PA03-1a]